MYQVLFLSINSTVSHDNKYNNIKIQIKHLYLKMSKFVILVESKKWPETKNNNLKNCIIYKSLKSIELIMFLIKFHESYFYNLSVYIYFCLFKSFQIKIWSILIYSYYEFISSHFFLGELISCQIIN